MESNTFSGTPGIRGWFFKNMKTLPSKQITKHPLRPDEPPFVTNWRKKTNVVDLIGSWIETMTPRMKILNFFILPRHRIVYRRFWKIEENRRQKRKWCRKEKAESKIIASKSSAEHTVINCSSKLYVERNDTSSGWKVKFVDEQTGVWWNVLRTRMTSSSIWAKENVSEDATADLRHDYTQISPNVSISFRITEQLRPKQWISGNLINLT